MLKSPCLLAKEKRLRKAWAPKVPNMPMQVAITENSTHQLFAFHQPIGIQKTVGTPNVAPARWGSPKSPASSA